MGWFRRKKKVVDSGNNEVVGFEEYYKECLEEERLKNRTKEEVIKENNEIKKRREKEILDEVKVFREASVDENEIVQYILTHLPEGENDFDGETFWVCRSCENGKRLESKEDFIAHQLSYHS